MKKRGSRFNIFNIIFSKLTTLLLLNMTLPKRKLIFNGRPGRGELPFMAYIEGSARKQERKGYLFEALGI